MKVYYKSPAEIEKMRAVNQVVREIVEVCISKLAPGISTWDINEIAAAEIDRRPGVTSAFLGYYDYPAVICTSVNEVVVHGIPRKDLLLKDGDIIGLDFGVFLDGYCGDHARTVPVGTISPQAQALIDATKTALDMGIAEARPGNRLGDVAAAVQSHAENAGFSVVRKFVGHGIGQAMHEDPPVPNHGFRGRGLKLKPGLVIAIEPMVNAGTHRVDVLADEWTAVTQDGQLSAHFEHSVAITEQGPLVLSSYSES